MKNFFLPLLFFILTSCSLFRTEDEYSEILSENNFTYNRDDYLEVLTVINSELKRSYAVQLMPLSANNKNYFTRLIKKITDNNELIFKTQLNPQIFIVKDKRPFYFSLPKDSIYISLGLIQRYLSNESFLALVLAHELYRLENNLYPKLKFVGKGYADLDEIIEQTRIDFNVKKVLNQWTYHILKRSGFDEGQYLAWIQIQNRNYLDFALQIGINSYIFNEELSFKEFLASESRQNQELELDIKNSPDFYRFIEQFHTKY
jgi:hypothetical protein